MSPSQEQFEQAITLIDAANAEDPNEDFDGSKTWPKELLYSRRMSDMLERYMPEADNVAKLAMRSQHIQRWKSPRDAFPMDRKGYHKWRTELYNFHAETAAGLLKQAGYSEEDMERVRQAVSKRGLKTNTDTQLVEDVAALVFIEHYMLEFVGKHPEYDEDKWIRIILRTWNKMTERGQQFALSGAIKLPETLLPLIQKAVA